MKKLKTYISWSLLIMSTLFGIWGLGLFAFDRNDPDLGVGLIGTAMIMMIFLAGADIFNPENKIK